MERVFTAEDIVAFCNLTGDDIRQQKLHDPEFTRPNGYEPVVPFMLVYSAAIIGKEAKNIESKLNAKTPPRFFHAGMRIDFSEKLTEDHLELKAQAGEDVQNCTIMMNNDNNSTIQKPIMHPETRQIYKVSLDELHKLENVLGAVTMNPMAVYAQAATVMPLHERLNNPTTTADNRIRSAIQEGYLPAFIGMNVSFRQFMPRIYNGNLTYQSSVVIPECSSDTEKPIKGFDAYISCLAEGQGIFDAKLSFAMVPEKIILRALKRANSRS